MEHGNASRDYLSLEFGFLAKHNVPEFDALESVCVCGEKKTGW